MPRKRNTPQSPSPASGNTSGYYCYVGPTIRSVLQTNTIVIGTYAEMLTRCAKAIAMAPTVKQLIVPGDKLQEVRNHIRNDINPEALLYKRVLKEIKPKEE